MTENSIKQPRILVVEDDPDTRDLVREVLTMHFGQGEGTNIVTAGSGAEALAQDIPSFDIILTDFNLPDATGLELLPEYLKRADVPVVFVTSENVSSTAAEAIRLGAQDYMIKLGDYLFAIPVVIEKNLRQHAMRLENRRLQQQRQQMLEELRIKNAQLEDSLIKMQRMAATDHLTGLANRRHFGELLERYHTDAMRYRFDLTCCMCDLDHYKKINDTLGHQVGDKLLIMTADVIRSSLRQTDLAARYGGDEFVLLLPHTSLDQAMTVAERIRIEVARQASTLPSSGHVVTMSMGIASLAADHPSNADSLVAMADRALYMAKDAGKNQIIALSHARLASQTKP